MAELKNYQKNTVSREIQNAETLLQLELTLTQWIDAYTNNAISTFGAGDFIAASPAFEHLSAAEVSDGKDAITAVRDAITTNRAKLSKLLP